MTHDEIIEMAQECRLIGMRPHLDGIYSEALVAFAKLVAEKTLAEHAMREVQRIGQEIEQERTWVGLSEEKQWEIARNISCFDWGELMSETEQALKELNT
jgi:hypothetical protein